MFLLYNQAVLPLRPWEVMGILHKVQPSEQSYPASPDAACVLLPLISMELTCDGMLLIIKQMTQNESCGKVEAYTSQADLRPMLFTGNLALSGGPALGWSRYVKMLRK